MAEERQEGKAIDMIALLLRALGGVTGGFLVKATSITCHLKKQNFPVAERADPTTESFSIGKRTSAHVELELR